MFKRLALIVFVLTIAGLLNQTGWLQHILTWIETFGFWGPAVFFIVYVLSCIFFIPSWIFTFSGGVLFGFWTGFFLSLFGNATGSLAAFGVGRFLARDWVERRLAGQKEFQKLSQAVKVSGWKMIALARLSPVFPFLILNYAFGITPLRAASYFFAALAGSIPSTAVYASLGTVLGSLAVFTDPSRQRSTAEWVLLMVGVIATLVLAFYLKSVAEKSLKTGQREV